MADISKGTHYYIYSLSVHVVPSNPSLQTHVDDGHVAPFIQPSFVKQGCSKRKEKQNVQSKNFQQTKTQNIETFISNCACICAACYFLLAV